MVIGAVVSRFTVTWGAIADSHAVPPVPTQLLKEVLGLGPAADDVGEPFRVAVEAALDRDPEKAGVAVEQVGEDVGAAAPGAADEDEVRGAVGGAYHA